MKIFYFFITLLLLFSTFYIDSISIGALWKNLHVNSLIGVQKYAEILHYSIWHNIFIPILNLKFLFFLALIQVMALIYNIRK